MASKPQVAVDNGNGKPAVAPMAGSVVPHINPKAIQKDLGPQIARMFAGVEEAKSEVERLRKEIGDKNYAAIAKLTMGVYNVAKIDNNVALADHFSEDSKRKLVLNESLYLAMGFKEVIKVGGGNKVDRVVWSRNLADLLPQHGEAPDTPEYERKNTFRTNLSKQLNKAIGAALDLHKRHIVAKEEGGTLLISGPEVQKQFGAPQVALNERINQGVAGSDGKASKLKEKPSFTALYNNAAKSEGHAVRSGSNDRTNKVLTDPSAAIVEVGTILLNALSRVAEPDKITKPAMETLEKIADALDSLGVR